MSTNSSEMTIEVKFLNTYYSGEFITTEDYDEVVADETVKKSREKDNDPNPHMTKTVRVPVVTGKVDKVALDEILSQQALGVRNRMAAAHASQTKKPIDLDKALGL